MGDKVLMKGNEALGEAAIRAGCRFFAGYPITPQNEVPAYLSRRLPEVGGVFVQAESEVAAINMIYGAAGAGARALTSSSSPGISLKQEGISYLVGAELPAVIVNIVRGGPGLGGIQPAQTDYFQSTRGGGHGDYRTLVFGPASVQELADLTALAFDVADHYRNPVLILGDGILGQMMEPLELPPFREEPLPEKPWATTGGGHRIINSLFMDAAELEQHNIRLEEKFQCIIREETRYEILGDPEAQIHLVAYGTAARIAAGAMEEARKEGIPVGLIRPITLWPFPTAAFDAVLPRARAFLTVEMSMGQMVEDVRLSVEGRAPVHFYGRTGGMVPTVRETLEHLRRVWREIN